MVVFEGLVMFQPIFLKDLGTATYYYDTTSVVVSFSLTHKGNFPIVLPLKSNVLSNYSFMVIKLQRFIDI